MRDAGTQTWPIHPRALAALPPEVWEHILGPAPALSGSREMLNWERMPERGVLHDPPERWYPVTRAAYFAHRARWLRGQEVPWPRTEAILSAWAARVDMSAYAVNARGAQPAAALLLWLIDDGRGQPVAYVPDLVWDPDVGIRSAGRYLLQELYLRHRHALAVVDAVPASSPLNHVLMALGYRVYLRWANGGRASEDTEWKPT